MAARGPVDKRGCSHETAQLAETNYTPLAQLAFPRGFIVHKQVDCVDSFNSFERYLRRIACSRVECSISLSHGANAVADLRARDYGIRLPSCRLDNLCEHG